MKTLTVEQVKEKGWLILEVIAGSRSYGLATATSDTDIKGVFVLPKEEFYGFEYIPQVNNETNDIVYYELKRFMELLSRNNPNILEMLYTPDNCVLLKHCLIEELKPGIFLSKLCQQTFANYAYTQIKKAYGLEKKIVNPVSEERKSVIDFCYVYTGTRTVPLGKYLEENQLQPQQVGLAAIDHLKDAYNMYYSDKFSYAGITRKEAANDVSLSSIPEGEHPIALLYFNKDGYSMYCKKYKEYWDWVEKRNDDRYNTTLSHGKKYDAKNMMHVFRLLLMAKEIALEGKLNVLRSDREFLLSVKSGAYEYDDLLKQAAALKEELPLLYQRSTLPEEPDVIKIEQLLIRIREKYYNL